MFHLPTASKKQLTYTPWATTVRKLQRMSKKIQFEINIG